METAQRNIRSIIEKGIAAGEFKADWDAHEFATVLFAVVEGGIMMSRVAGHNQAMKVIARSLKKQIEEQSA
ncbi:MAG: hypothetical protein AVDCRST_MAG56-5605 [uncultured Cytophagales bacterium]|uniref:Tetracyclin repressor-like C-terminal domain-containing protein n=1 Tax=uncultured Cytophagales bacterium TaxID=158755 RepID=A0A6J4KGG2_9SPHI|nr:MAG: hypothetical protein AVDCRST_MAG56-5605 [uncultured Cytophagales bacterium]